MEQVKRSESWLPVVGWEGFYEVSDLGWVRGLDRLIRHSQGGLKLWRGRVLKAGASSAGYLQVRLCRDGTVVTRTVHSLVLEAFAGPCPPGMESLHGRGGNQDNRWPENLRWGTRPENVADRIRDGGYATGSANHKAKLTEAIVITARRREAQGETSTALAREFGVSLSSMHAAIHGKTWRHVPFPEVTASA